jgi:hypothetical protein
MKPSSRIHTQPTPVWSSSLPYWTRAQPRRTPRRGAAVVLQKLREIRASRASRRRRALP